MEDDKLSIGGGMVSLSEVGDGMASLDLEVFLQAIRSIILKRGSESLKLLVDGLEIQLTPSAFREGNEANVAILERVAEHYPFTRWLEENGRQPATATRQDLCQWWGSLMAMAAEYGYTAAQINAVSRTNNLWKATGPLAAQMQADPAAYRSLPPLLVNHPQEVDRVLREISEPGPFLEVLTGERLGDLRRSPRFIGAFSFVKKDDGQVSREIPDALWSIQLLLQRG